MAKLQKKMISMAGGDRTALDAFLKQYRAEYKKTSSTEKGQVFWSAPVTMWILVMVKKVKGIPHAQLTFHAADNCPCQLI